jgi:hypothetical protein
MNRRAAVIAAAAAGTVAVTALFLLRTPASEPEQPVATAAPAPSRAATPRGPAAEPAAPERPRRSAVEPGADVAGEEETAAPVAEAAAIVGTLRIGADVPGAQVFIDRQFIGTAPALAENLAPGSHQLNVSAEGFESYAGTVDISPGDRDIVIKLREVRLDSSLEVIHRHRIGSCRGRLVATPQGLRYETGNRDDAFSVSLVELEAFQVEYLDKNLLVKLPKGRQFNFTDPDGNADRLFVFHRDVDKARERLRKGDPPATN